MNYYKNLNTMLDKIAKDSTRVVHDGGNGLLVECRIGAWEDEENGIVVDYCELCALDYQDQHRDDAHDEEGIYE